MEAYSFFSDGLAPVVWVVPLLDPCPSPPLFEVRSEYVETVWLSVLGPSATWALRRLGTLVSAFPTGTWIDTAELGECLGLGGGQALLRRTLRRLVMFSMAAVDGHTLLVRPRVGAVSPRMLERLPLILVSEHRRMVVQARERCAA